MVQFDWPHITSYIYIYIYIYLSSSIVVYPKIYLTRFFPACGGNIASGQLSKGDIYLYSTVVHTGYTL